MEYFQYISHNNRNTKSNIGGCGRNKWLVKYICNFNWTNSCFFSSPIHQWFYKSVSCLQRRGKMEVFNK